MAETKQLEKRRAGRTDYTVTEDVIPESAKATRADAEKVIDSADALMDEIDAVLEINPEPEKPYTLADAIREGSLLNPQKIGGWRGPQGETCAISAAYDAVKARGLL